MSDSIEDVFNSLIKETETFIDSASGTFLHNASKLIAETWANDIIEMLVSEKLQPSLSKETIERRQRRDNNILGPDYPLLETGEWITYIEFRINQFTDHDEIEVGVWDETTQLGHTSEKTPAYIAEINEDGNDKHIQGRHLFSTSELRIHSKIDDIIINTWDKLNITDVFVNVSPHNLVGKIISDGSSFTFRWTE